MPELPEVETIVRELRKKIIGLRITDIWVDPERPVKTGHGAGWSQIKKYVIGKKIVGIRRRAKYIVLDLEGPKTIFIHQKISGHLLYGRWELIKKKWEAESGPLRDDSRNGYIRLVMFLNNNFQLGLSDLRRFAKLILVDDNKVKDLKEMSKLGPEPLDLTFNQFRQLFTFKKGRLKQVLMDPKFIAGIGNIYGDEILWDAGYHPFSRVEGLKNLDLKKIYSSTKKVLLKAIKYQGDSMDDYRLPSGLKGRYQTIQKAYQQTGKKCLKKDGGIIQRLKLNQRSAHFCSVHQKLL
ncbi:MAG: hypothetical protein HYW77_00845 [Parcubacteria group bacterium]|nr:hypothetical protein [Parcubacteria group bacterium]